MKITIPIDIWDPKLGGLERYLDLLGRSLRSRGHEVVILCARREGAGLEDDSSGVSVEVLDVPWRPRWLREWRFAKASVERHRESGRDLLFAVRHALEADVYQPHGGSFRTASKGALVGMSAPTKLLRSLARWLRPSYHVLSSLDGQVFRRSPNVLTLSLSEVVENSLQSAFPDVSMRFERIYNGIPLEQFHDRDREERVEELRAKFEIPREAPVALFLAHQFRAKGLEHAIRSLSAAPEWHLVVGGRGRREPWDPLISRLALEGRVHFAGAISDPRAAYAGSDAFVLPTYYDSCSLSVLEAFACGTPAITTTRNGASEMYEDGVEGFVIKHPTDEGAIARGLRSISADRDLFRQRALLAATRFSWEDHVDAVLAALERRREEGDRNE